MNPVTDLDRSEATTTREDESSVDSFYRGLLAHGTIRIGDLLADRRLLAAAEEYLRDRYPHLVNNWFLYDLVVGDYNAQLEAAMNKVVIESLIRGGGLRVSALRNNDLLEASIAYLGEKYPDLHNEDFLNQLLEGEWAAEIESAIAKAAEAQVHTHARAYAHA